ncbi:MAG TPA: aminopeptidase P family protein [Nitrososphaeraceae archaeon]|nr:aminopeptidase P family protein [Nitrososphaeraceae archaeon]
MFKERARNIINSLSNEANALMVFKPENIFYLTGFWGESIALCTHDGIKLFVPKLERSRAANESKDSEIITAERGSGLMKSVIPNLPKYKFYSDCSNYETVQSILPHTDNSSFVINEDPFRKARIIKDDSEIERIRRASDIIDKLYQVCSEEIKKGMTEKQLQAKLLYEAMELEGTSTCYPFTLNPFIVAGGANSALPHFETSKREFADGDFIVVDLTIRYDGYISDATRTFALGNVSSEMSQVYDIVKKSQQQGLECVEQGVECGKVDSACRTLISKYGYGDNFIHSTGHGVGLEVHEQPWIRPNESKKLSKSMVITVEPGIYMDTKFGIRIEDTVLVNENINTNPILTKFSKELLIL